MDEREHTGRARRIEQLLQEIADLPDPRMRERAEELIGALLALYGDALARIVALADQVESAGEPLVRTFAGDDLIGPLLLMHGLHPIPIETRLAQALEGVRPYLRSHGGNVELVDVTDGVAHLRLQGSCHGCPSSTMTLKLAIEEAIYAAAPDLDGLDVEGVAELAPSPLITLTPAHRRPSANRATPDQPGGEWTTVEGIAPPAVGTLQAATVRGRALVFCRIGETWYAYLNRCPRCAALLDSGALDGAILTCAACGGRYDVVHAGRGLEDDRNGGETHETHLEPVPLLAEGGAVKVALPAVIETEQATSVAVR
jgi:Fe-S cluster biogenesis protein NfuA/nitrite reductase/ring-hydroxylating ferredoxin subunit